MPLITPKVIVTYWANVDKTEGCWFWLGKPNRDGYGTITINRVNYIASRFSYWFHYHKEPGALQVCHECENPICVKPEHLFLGTESENMLHAFQTGRKDNRGENHSQAKLTEKEVLRIRELEGTMSKAALGRLFNVNYITISLILSRKNWSHI